MGDFLEEMPGFVEELVVLGATFSCSGFDAVGAMGYGIGCEAVQQDKGTSYSSLPLYGLPPLGPIPAEKKRPAIITTCRNAIL